VHDPLGAAFPALALALKSKLLGLVAAGEGGMSQEEKAKMVLDDLADRLPEQYDMEDIRSRVDEVTPYVMVAIQVRVLGVRTLFHQRCRHRLSTVWNMAPVAITTAWAHGPIMRSCLQTTVERAFAIVNAPYPPSPCRSACTSCVTCHLLLHPAVLPYVCRSLSA
jgi:hypothetical protein